MEKTAAQRLTFRKREKPRHGNSRHLLRMENAAADTKYNTCARASDQWCGPATVDSYKVPPHVTSMDSGQRHQVPQGMHTAGALTQVSLQAWL